MSEPLYSNPIQHYKRTPKKFLKKGEGLKRFAAYKPPLPIGSKKKRQTVVKFDLNNKYADSTYIPDILLDDSLNLSMEVPKIGPPKFIHTPMRPPTTSRLNLNNDPTTTANTRSNTTTKHQNDDKVSKKTSRRYNLRKRGQIEAVVQRHITPPPSPKPQALESSPNSPSTPPKAHERTTEAQINGNIDNLMKKIKQKKTVLDQENISTRTSSTNLANTTVNNNYKPNNNNISLNDNEQFERCRTPLGLDSHQAKSKKSPQFDLSTPLAGSTILAMGNQIKQILSTVNELKEKFKNCSCGMEAPPKPVARITRRTQQSRTAKNDKTSVRPSAIADNPTSNLLINLLDEVAQLKDKFDEIQLAR